MKSIIAIIVLGCSLLQSVEAHTGAYDDGALRQYQMQQQQNQLRQQYMQMQDISSQLKRQNQSLTGGEVDYAKRLRIQSDAEMLEMQLMRQANQPLPLLD